MKLIIGLGNPGIRYRNTRHSLGSLIVKELARRLKARFKIDFSIKASIAKAQVENEDLILAVPLTYMNLSGGPVSLTLRKYKINSADILVVCDELDLELGKLRLRRSGSHGGHKGLKSIIDNIKTADFNRLRVGIGRPVSRDPEDISRFVLSSFKRSESKIISDCINNAVGCCLAWFNEGPDKAMSKFN